MSLLNFFKKQCEKYNMKKKLSGILIILITIVVANCDAKNFRHRANKNKYVYTEKDIDAEINFGRKLSARILGNYKLLENKKITEYVNMIGKGIAAQYGRPELKFFFGVLDTTEINAYAIPGGYIFITKGALDLMDNEAQLAGVISHEISHINKRHVVEQLKLKGENNSFLYSVGTAIGGGAVSGVKVINKLIDKAFDIYFNEGFDKKKEFEADSECIQIIAGIGYDWKAYVEYLNKLDSYSNSKKGKVISKTHPPVLERIQQITKEAKKYEFKNISGKQNPKRFSKYLDS